MTVDAIMIGWSDYERLKWMHRSDSKLFDFRAEWEVNYLSGKLKSIYPFIPENIIKNSINACSRELSHPCPRQEFLSCVLERLGIPL
jgi:hypothetical protein